MSNFEDLPADQSPEPSSAAEAYEQKEALEAAIEASLAHSVKCNEGKNALILHLDLDQLDRKWVEDLLPGVRPESGQLASKVLKIYVPGEAQREADRQERAREILSQVPAEQAAQVPQVYVSRDLEIKDRTLMDSLRMLGFRSQDNKISLIMMDYIEGPDLAAYIFEKVIRQHPGLADLKKRLEEGEQLEEEEMSRRVALALGFESPPTTIAGDDIPKNFITNASNSAKLSRYLRDEDVVLDKQVFDKVEQAIRILHANQLYHNDLHERNVMLELGEDGTARQVYLIDFATADTNPDDRVVGTDLDIVKKYQPLTQTKEERQAEADKKFWVSFDLATWEKAITRNQAKQELWDELKKDAQAILQAKNTDMLDHLLAVTRNYCIKITSDDRWQELAATFLLAALKNDPSLLKQCLKLAKDTSKPQSLQNFWQNIINRLPAD